MGDELRDFAPLIELRGARVSLVPMRPEHYPGLFRETPEETFKYFLSWPSRWTRECFDAWMTGMCVSAKSRVHAVVDNATGEVLGSSSFMDLDPGNKALEIGATWYIPRVRGTGVNAECKLLMLTRAIEELGCVRVTLKCDARNLHSQAAIASIGATREGTLRRHRIQSNGFVRDTVYFSVIAEEWPQVKARLEDRVRGK